MHTPVIVLVHGISRNADEHLAVFKSTFGKRFILVAPLFDKTRYQHYQSLGVNFAEPRADWALDAALDNLENSTGVQIRRFHLFGYSGGAQFSHRYAQLNPHRVRTLHLSSAGYYTFYDSQARWPRGSRGTRLDAELHRNMLFFLRIPQFVYVGERDIFRDSSLRKNERIDAQQGINRVERAHRWCEHINSLRRLRGLHQQSSVDLLPKADHAFCTASDKRYGNLPLQVARNLDGIE